MITLYTIGCPKCTVLEKKLKQANIEFNIVSDLEEMKKLSIESTPMLKVDDKLLSFVDAVKYINSL